MQASLARRYTGKLLANIATVPVYLAMEVVLPRALGVQAYGNYNFATSVFTQFTAFLDMGTSTCFYNALSRRQEEAGLVAFYARVAVLVMGVSLLVGGLLYLPVLGEAVLPDVPAWYAPLAAVYGFLLWASRVARSMNDAVGRTVSGELVRSAINLGGTALLLALFFLGLLNVGTLFGLQYLMMGGMVVGSLALMRRSWPDFSLGLAPGAAGAYTREFTAYSSPLFVQALLSSGGLTAERWLLQWADGSVQQGYFALSQRVGIACFMFVSAMTPLLMRELAIAWGDDNRDRMADLVDRFAPLLFAIAAWFSCFTVVEAGMLVRLFGGSEFLGALIPVQIMALYPAHQVYGQLASSVFHATGKTRILRDLAFVEHGGGLILASLLLVPPAFVTVGGISLGGLGLGATGLAIKMVITQMVMVNLLLWLASRFIPLHFARNLTLQVVMLGVLLLIAFCARELTLHVAGTTLSELLRFGLSGMLYALVSGCVLLLCPALAGLSRRECKELLARFAGRRMRR